MEGKKQCQFSLPGLQDFLLKYLLSAFGWRLNLLPLVWLQIKSRRRLLGGRNEYLYYFVRYKGAFLPTGAHMWPTLNTFKVSITSPEIISAKVGVFKKIHSIITAVREKNGLELEFGKAGIVHAFGNSSVPWEKKFSAVSRAQAQPRNSSCFAGRDSTGEHRFLCQMVLPDSIPSAASLHSPRLS